MTLAHAAVVATFALGSLLASGPASPAGPSEAAAATGLPAVRVTTLASGLNVPWDLAVLPDGTLLLDERGGGFSLVTPSGTRRAVTADLSDLRVEGEAGLMGLVLDAGFARNHTFYTCQASTAPDVRVVRWRLDRSGAGTGAPTATRVGAPLLTGIPASTFHQGCRLRLDADGYLQVGTGDAGIGTTPQDVQSLSGKTLRLRTDGRPAPGNPFAAQGGNAAYVWTTGHRNVQGLALRPGTREMWNAEHGPDRDDEVNLGVRGGNYGWNPVPGYDQSVPMTDLAEFPDARVAAWSSGFPTVATSGLTFLRGSAWGTWEGALAVGLLKGEGVLLLRFGTGTRVDQVVAQRRLPALDGTHGRIRTVQSGPGGVLYVTTSDADGRDEVLAVTPR